VSGNPHTVHIVVDSSFGDRLVALPIGDPVWIVDSFRNRPAILRCGKQRLGNAQLASITAFAPAGGTAEEILLVQLDTIDLHHGELCADLPWGVAVVYGASPTPALAAAFRAMGFGEITPTAEGFIGRRKP